MRWILLAKTAGNAFGGHFDVYSRLITKVFFTLSHLDRAETGLQGC